MPEIIFSIFLLLFGLGVLAFSSDWFLQGAVKFAYIYKLSLLFIGAVLVAFGTSVPEAGVSIIAALKNHKEIVLGNILGSNIVNIGLGLGLCALLIPLTVADRVIFKREMPFMAGSVILLYILSWDLVISRLDGLIFLVCFFGFCWFSYHGSKKIEKPEEIEVFGLKKIMRKISSKPLILAVTVFGLAGVVAGADLMVRGGVSLARILGISPWIIGITVLAVGTSLPEIATSLAAALKKAHSISLGNIVGSNIFNILFILGIASLIRPIQLDKGVLKFGMPVLLVFTIALFVIMRTGYKISRKEGAVLFLGYLIFLGMLFFSPLP